MIKKGSIKVPSQKSQKKREATEIQGLLVLTASLMMFLSLISFAGQESRNWLGVMGSTIGWMCHALFGIGSYVICLYLSWIGWRLLFNKTINHLALKTLYVALFVVSFCMLLSLVEDQYPSVGTFLGHLFYKNLWQRKLRYHLGGAPFFFLYRDLPLFNLSRIFNTLGVVILFSSTFIASILFLAKISPKYYMERLIASIFKKRTVASVHSVDASKKGEVSNEKESDFFRFVKLRIPGQNQHSPSGHHTMDPQAVSSEMLAIQPETNLKTRPSLSHKEKSEQIKDRSFDENFLKSKKKEIPDISTSQSLDPKQQGKATLSHDKDSMPRKREAALSIQQVHNGDFRDYRLPSPLLLTQPKKIDHSSLKQDLRRKAEVLEETLLSFGIEAKVGQINCGPTITSFEVHPAIGVKVQKIKTLENDIALNMEAKSIRIIAPIPGKAAVGVEVPNSQAEEVAFKDMLLAYQHNTRKFHIPILLGKAVNGDFVMSDLTKMPHCIIAGATGSGKSVCINTIVMSILMNAKPDEIKLIMVDPKKVELTPYARLPHMLAPVITEPQGACAAMNWLVKEMEKRYDLLKQIGARNIEAFNNRTVNKDFEASLDLEIPTKLPYIVGIIDELADLMMVSSSDIETPIARIAQMARAIGIHLILATQRPSREVITGLIKANFPTRISFKVSSRVNSQIILDDVGAESLLGNGDMLFLPPGASHLVRTQGAFIRDEDINIVVKIICDQAPPNYVIESFDTIGQIEMSDLAEDKELPSDSFYPQALDIVLSTGNASTTFLQRKLKIGYARAASLIDLLEEKGIVGPAEGSKPRKILVARQGSQEDDSSDLFENEEREK
jgi:DNA segregation ATPase FtsK/SpoIIIE, S-DNA-T family